MIGMYLVDTVYRVRQPIDQWGEPVGRPVTTRMSGKVDWGTRTVTDQAGKQIVAQGSILMGKTAVVQAGDKIRIDGTEYPVVGWKKRSDFNSRYIEVYV